MNNQQEVFALISKLSGSKNKIVADMTLCKFMGSLQGGVFLSQLLYWSDKGRDGWFYKTYAEWHEETFLSEYETRQQVKICKEYGFLETDVRKANGNPTVHYRMDSHKFLESIMKFLSNDNENFIETKPKNLQEPYTESTTETTTETTGMSFAAQKVTPQQELFGAICEAVGWDYKTLSKDDKGQVAQLCGILGKANYTIDDIRHFMTDIWFKDWRWVKEQQHPTLKQLRQEIGKLRSVIPTVAPVAAKKGIEGFMALGARQGIDL
jgi:hypothetical protein